MENLFQAVNRFHPVAEYSAADWNEAIQFAFRPFLRRTSVIRRHKELFRTEFMNLAKIAPLPANTRLLRDLLRLYRRVLNKTPRGFDLLAQCFADIGASDERWMGMFMNMRQNVAGASAYDRAFRTFDLIDSVLEGAYKPQLRVLYAMLALNNGKDVLASLDQKAFGVMIDSLPQDVANLDLLTQDFEHDLPFNQWRNIAAHKDFKVLSGKYLEIHYGPPKQRQKKRITIASSERVLAWCVIAHGTLRLCNVLIYIEYMPEIQKVGIPEPTIRLEGHLTALCHNLAIVGFRCVSRDERKGVFTLRLTNRLPRNVRDAIIHASQVLDQLGVHILTDPSRKGRINMVAVELLDEDSALLARACVAVESADAVSSKKISRKTFLDHMEFAINVPLTTSAQVSK